jgi:peroxiredoxin
MYFLRLIFLVLFLFFSGLGWAMGHLSDQAAESPLVGKTAPDAVLTKTDGTSASIISEQQGKKAILIFWATWCPHCYEDLGALYDNVASIERKGIKIILVDVGEPKQGVKDYLGRRQMKLVSFIDEDSVLQGPYHLFGVPTVIFIDEKGIIRSVTHQFPSDYENYFSVK